MNIYLVILIVIAIVLFSNLAIFALARNLGNMKTNWLNTTQNSLSKPFKEEENQLNELREKIKELNQADSTRDQKNT